ncbi:general substrate transporter [Hysterangium stoloniferum]|nr:general substrate transporter [Hysterangium stoloniferum]
MSDLHGSTHHKIVGKQLLYAISCFASLGVFLFGYDQGVMSGIITNPYFKSYFHNPLPYEVGTMVSVLEIGAFITSLAAGRIADIVGRRMTLFWGATVFVVGGAIQTWTTGYIMMVIGRIVSGFGVGLLSTIVPIYQSEVSPAEHRGALACMEFTGNILGYASSVWVDYFCSYLESDYAWRIPLSMQCVIGTILAIGSLFMPESPRWLIDTGKDEEGMIVIADLHGGNLDDEKAKEEFQEIRAVVELERTSGDRSYTAMWRRYKYRVLIAMSSQAFAQLASIYLFIYCAVFISYEYFRTAGWVGRNALLMTGINALIYIASTIPTWFLVDRWGRRVILLSGAVIMGIALVATGYWMNLDVPATPNAVVICVVIFNAAFGYSWGPLPWLYPPEIMPLAHRAKGVSLSTATNWLFNWLVGQVTPTLQSTIKWRLYPMHGFFCACSFILVYFLYPETKGIPLEEMDRVFGEGNILIKSMLSNIYELMDSESASDEESERASLVRSGGSSLRNHRTISPPNSQGPLRTSQSWFDKLIGRVESPRRGEYRRVDSQGDE